MKKSKPSEKEIKKTKVVKKTLKKVVKKTKPEVKEAEKVSGMTGFWGSKSVEDSIKGKIGFLANDCTFDYMPFSEDIRSGKSQFIRYDVVCKHKDGEVILHYKVNFDSSGRFVPEAIVDNVNALRMIKG